ncbi:ATP-grasp domain-containing protein [Micromonospora musae]|uniref:ATP-grasp domain-containing protein n=1 Tax=Micromonospora musae TaxID=1894970 RepID=UPI0033F687F2
MNVNSTDAVLVLSIRGGGMVRPMAEIIRSLPARSVLVSNNPDDRNRDACDEHVVVDWLTDELPVLVERLAARGIRPVAVVNNLEPLITWQAAILRHYELPLGDSGLGVFADKAAVRRRVRELGLSGLRFWSSTAEDLATLGVDHFPVIVKPSRDSGASRFVRRADDADELRRCAAEIAASLGRDAHVVVEEYIDGVEHSLDGPVLDGRFRPLLHVEKLDHDERRHHDAGLCVSPPLSVAVRQGTAKISPVVDALCRDLRLDNLWLHVEARTRADGTCELVEINTRPGGRLYRAAVQRTTGIDPFEANLRLALPGIDDSAVRAAARNDELVAMVVFDAQSVGRVHVATSREDVLGVPGVVDALVLDGLEITTLEQENTVAEALITADDLPALRSVEEAVRAQVKYEIS